MFNLLTGFKKYIYIAGAVVLAVFAGWFKHLKNEVEKQKIKLDNVNRTNAGLKAEIEEAVKVTEIKQEIEDVENDVSHMSDDDVDDRLLSDYTRNNSKE